MATEKGKTERNTQGNSQGEHLLKTTGWKTRGAQFCEFLQPVGGVGVLKVSGLGLENPNGTALLLERRQKNNPGTDSMETAILRTPEAHSGKIILTSWSMSLSGSIHRDNSLGTKKLAGPFLSLFPQHKHRAT